MDILKMVDNKAIFEYLESLFGIIDSWQSKYINLGVIDVWF